MNLAFRALAAHTRAHLAIMFQYRGEILLWSVWGIVNPAVLYVMWSSAAGSNPAHAIAGYDRGAFAAYYLMMMIVGHLTTAWDVYQMGHFVRTGVLSPQLLEPVLPMWRSVAENITYKIVTLMFTVPAWIVFTLFVSPQFKTSAWEVSAGLVATILGSVLAYLLGYTIAIVAFWAPKLDALGEVYFGLGMFLGGRFAPIPALPPAVASVAKVLPFRWMYEFPCELFVGGRLTPTEAGVGLLMQIGWLGVTLILFRVLWAAGLKRYTAVSG